MFIQSSNQLEEPLILPALSSLFFAAASQASPSFNIGRHDPTLLQPLQRPLSHLLGVWSNPRNWFMQVFLHTHLRGTVLEKSLPFFFFRYLEIFGFCLCSLFFDWYAKMQQMFLIMSRESTFSAFPLPLLLPAEYHAHQGKECRLQPLQRLQKPVWTGVFPSGFLLKDDFRGA